MTLEDEEIIETVPLIISTTLAPFLHAISGAPKDDRLKVRMKKQHGWIWVEQPADSHHPTFNKERAAACQANQSHPLAFDFAKTRALVGDLASCSDQFVMVRRPDGIHMTPIAGTTSLRPSLLPLDLAISPDVFVKGAMKRPEGANEQRIAPQFQKRETEEQQAARLSSYEHLHKVWEEEPWEVMSHYPEDTLEAGGISRRLISTGDHTDELSVPVNDMAAFMRNLGVVDN